MLHVANRERRVCDYCSGGRDVVVPYRLPFPSQTAPSVCSTGLGRCAVPTSWPGLTSLLTLCRLLLNSLASHRPHLSRCATTGGIQGTRCRSLSSIPQAYARCHLSTRIKRLWPDRPGRHKAALETTTSLVSSMRLAMPAGPADRNPASNWIPIRVIWNVPLGQIERGVIPLLSFSRSPAEPRGPSRHGVQA